MALNTTLEHQIPIIYTPEELMGLVEADMYEDPIVAEAHRAWQASAEQAEGDLHTFFEFLREVQQNHQDRLVQSPLGPPQEANLTF